jgi:hypothetical protein
VTSGNPSRDARLETISGTPEPVVSSGGRGSRTVRSARNSTFLLTRFPARRIGVLSLDLVLGSEPYGNAGLIRA